MYSVAKNEAEAEAEWKAYPFNKEDVETKSERFIGFVTSWVRMMDMTVNMLGPDLDLLQEQLWSLGERHAEFDVLPVSLSSRHRQLSENQN